MSSFDCLQNSKSLGRKAPSQVLMGSPAAGQSSNRKSDYDRSFKILLIGDSGVGKSSLIASFISDAPTHASAPTIGVDFNIKYFEVGGKKLKLIFWDTAGQERFRTLTTSFYRGAQGIVLVYDVTRKESFESLTGVWEEEIKSYSSDQNYVKMLVGNKKDQESERKVSTEEGLALARKFGGLFLECSAKTRENVDICFENLALQILEVPNAHEHGTAMGKIVSFKHEEHQTQPGSG
ncbi:unnamed protein product, partial [Cuscuta epithymum]